MSRPPSPHPLFAIGSGFMGAQLLLSAVELDVFAVLGEEGRSLADLAGDLGASAEALRLVLDGLVALELLGRVDERYVNTPVTRAYLMGAAGDDLRPFFRHWRRHGYLAWSHLTEALRGEPVRSGWQDGWLEAAAAVAPEAARPLARAPELGGRSRVLVAFDASAAVVTAILRAHPHARASLAETPGRHLEVRASLETAGVAERATLLATDPLRGPFEAAHDAAVVVHAMHLQSAERNEELAQNLARAIAPGAPVLLVDHWLDETRTSPSYAAVSAAELFLATGEGRNYAVDEVRQWLERAGLVFEAHRALVGPASVIVARRPA